MDNEPRTPIEGDYVECQIHVGPNQVDWFKGKVYGVRGTSFDVLFDPPVGPLKVGAGLFHFHHEGSQWRFAAPDPVDPPAALTEEPETTPDE